MLRRINSAGKRRVGILSGWSARPSVKSTADQKSAAPEKLNAELGKLEEDRDDAYNALNKDQAEYDKQLLTLSGAFLALSLAFIKDVVPLQRATHLWELYFSFALMAGCIFLVLSSFQYSIHGNFRVVKFYDVKEESLSAEDEEQPILREKMKKLRDGIARHGKRMRVLNLTSGLLFFLGAVILVVFVISNIEMDSRANSNSSLTSEDQSMSGTQHLTPQPSPQPSPHPHPVPRPNPTPIPGSYPKPPRSKLPIGSYPKPPQ